VNEEDFVGDSCSALLDLATNVAKEDVAAPATHEHVL
jgi:hypothetical protein